MLFAIAVIVGCNSAKACGSAETIMRMYRPLLLAMYCANRLLVPRGACVPVRRTPVEPANAACSRVSICAASNSFVCFSSRSAAASSARAGVAES